jgi:hypothetical protein
VQPLAAGRWLVDERRQLRHVIGAWRHE